MEYGDVLKNLKEIGQEQLLKFYDDLSVNEKRALLEQVSAVDFGILDLLDKKDEMTKKGVITPLKGQISIEEAKDNQMEGG